MRIITFGTFDLFHIGHINILNRCKLYNINENNQKNTLIVGVSSDKLNYEKKQHYPIINEIEREKIVFNIKGVDLVFSEESLGDKKDYCIKYKADILIMGDDHKGRFDFLKEDNIEVVYLERTKDISTTLILDKINSNENNI
jgi:glycerol-3-phosphate cytidylyltransferase